MSKSLGRTFSPKSKVSLTNYATVRSNSYCSLFLENDQPVMNYANGSLAPSIKAWTTAHASAAHYDSFQDITFPYYYTSTENMTTRSVNPYQSPPSFYYSHMGLPQNWASPATQNGSSGYYPVHIATLGRSRTEYGRQDQKRLHTPPSFMASSSKLYEKRKSSPFSSTSTVRRQSISSNYTSGSNTIGRTSMTQSPGDSGVQVQPRRAQQVMLAIKQGMESRLNSISKKAEALHSEIQQGGATEERTQEITGLLQALDREAKDYNLLSSTVDDLQKQYFTQIKLFEEAHKFSTREASPAPTGRSRKLSPTPSFKGGIKQIAQNLNYIENEIEKLMGTLHVELKGIQGFARIAPGDVYEVVLRHGQQKWKSRGKAKADRTQKWDHQSVVLKCLVHEPLEIKASEVKLLGKSNNLGEQSCDLTRLFSAEPQLMTVNLNLNGSLKLHLVITWKPAESTVSKDVANNHWSFATQSPLSSKSPKFSKKIDSKSGVPNTMAGFPSENVNSNISKTMPSVTGQSSISPRLIRSRPDRRIPLEFLENGTVNINSNYKPPPLLALLRALKPLIQKLLLSYPDLTGLHDVFFKLDALLKRSLLPPSVRSPRSNRKTLDLGSGLNGLHLDQDGDNLDDNFLTRSEKSETLRTHDSGFDSLRMGRTPQPDYIQPIISPSTNNNDKLHSGMRDKRKSWMGSEGSPDLSWTSPVPPSTGNPQIDTCLHHHFRYCHVLLKNLEQLYGPLRHRRREIRMKLSEETSTLYRLLHMTRHLTILPNLNTLLLELDATHELQDIWMSITGSSDNTLHVDHSKIRDAISNKYSHIVKSRYPDLVNQVLDKVDYWLSDRYCYSTELVTVFQFVSCFRDKQLTTFIESLAHETWINASLKSKVRASVEQVMDRLSRVPIAPPQLCLAEIAIILVDQPQISDSIEEYLKRCPGALRTDLVSAFTVLLESDDPSSRKGACKALAILKARESSEYLSHLAKCDTKTSVREEATKSLAFITPGVHKIKINDDEEENADTKPMSTKF